MRKPKGEIIPIEVKHVGYKNSHGWFWYMCVKVAGTWFRLGKEAVYPLEVNEYYEKETDPIIINNIFTKPHVNPIDFGERLREKK